MKKNLIFTLVALSISIIAGAQNAQEIIKKSFEANKIAGSESLSTLTIKDAKGRERVRKTSIASKLYDNGETEKKIIRFLEPADVKGTGMLMFDYQQKEDDMWIYMPALRKTRRIVSSEKSKSFMGSEFTNSDIVIPNISDFNYKILKNSENINRVDCWSIEVTPKNQDIAGDYGYSKRIVWIGKEDYVLRKAQVYDLNDDLLKNLNVKKIKLIDVKNKKYQPTYLEIENVQSGRSSILEIDKIIFNSDVKDSYFTTSFLENM